MEEKYSWGWTRQEVTRKDWENSEEQGVQDVIHVSSMVWFFLFSFFLFALLSSIRPHVQNGKYEAIIGDDERGLEMHMRPESQVSSFFIHSFCFTNNFCTISEL